MAAQAIYNALLHPNYQLWDTKVNNKNITHTHILVPPGLDEEQVREACRYQANQAAKRVNTIIVSAFEKEENKEAYDFGHLGNRWQLHINKNTDVEIFQNIAIRFGRWIKIRP